jgi:hypothetical protein
MRSQARAVKKEEGSERERERKRGQVKNGEQKRMEKGTPVLPSLVFLGSEQVVSQLGLDGAPNCIVCEKQEGKK